MSIRGGQHRLGESFDGLSVELGLYLVEVPQGIGCAGSDGNELLHIPGCIASAKFAAAHRRYLRLDADVLLRPAVWRVMALTRARSASGGRGAVDALSMNCEGQSFGEDLFAGLHFWPAPFAVNGGYRARQAGA